MQKCQMEIVCVSN